jgi:cyclopropane-fatty-acyl-phospholipid synthase
MYIRLVIAYTHFFTTIATLTESLRLHYALTTTRWAENFEKVTDKVREKYGEHFVRMWRLYLWRCSSSFKCSGLDAHQLLLSKGVNNDLPLGRQS